MNPALVIIGTDTDVGKTFIAARLLAYLQEQGRRPGYVKLVSCGGSRADDCQYCQQEAALAPEQSRYLYHFTMAASPHLAAKRQGRQVDAALLSDGIAQAREDFPVVIVEGAGGLLVPLSDDLLLAEFLVGQGLPLLLVARSGLGTLNHSLLTIQAARHYGLHLAGIIFSDEREYEPDNDLVADNMTTIARLGGVPVLGRMPRCREPGQAGRYFQPLAEKISAKFL